MGRRVSRISIAILIAAALFLPPLIVEACGPDLSPPTFTNYNAPDAPLDVYARGNLGLLEPGYFHIFLYGAYRNLTGKPPSDAEIAIMKNPYASPSYPIKPQQAAETQPPPNWIDRWQAARRNVLPDTAKINFGYYTESGVFRSFQKEGNYVQYYNCLEGAFQNAVQVLDRRVAQFGAQSPFVKQWLAAQDQVFANCPGGFGYPAQEPAAVIPVAAPASDPAVIREDRAYQIAAAHFYAGNFEQARTEFAAIAKDTASPYHKIGPYLVARVLVREGTLTPGIGTVNTKALERAERQLQTILADRNLAEMHDDSEGLLEFVRIRLYPQERERELESALAGDKPDPDFRQNLIDYLWMLDHPVPAAGTPGSSAGPTAQPPATVETAQQHTPKPERGEMTDWILTFQKSGPEAFQHSLSRWHQTHSLPWLVAAISHAQGSDAAAGSLAAAALKVAPHSPAYVTVTFHRLRLLAASGQAEQARAGLNRVLGGPALDLSDSARNEFLALRMTLATSLEDWLRYAPRAAAADGWYPPTSQDLQKKPPSYFDSDASAVLTEKMPLRLVAEAAQSARLPAGLRKQIAIAAWTRAILLHDESIAERMTPVLAALAPELKRPLAAYASAKSGAERKFGAAFLILQFPAMRPFVGVGEFRVSYRGPERFADLDPFRDNWWCTMSPPSQNDAWAWNYYTMYTRLSPPLRQIYPDGKMFSPAFLNADERATAAKEWAAVQSLPAAPSWLGRETISWAKARPNDPRVPQALHLVVRATRYGCLDADSGKYSRQAFTLLHSRYPNSTWSKKTRYWYK
jgi:hypothetical protein